MAKLKKDNIVDPSPLNAILAPKSVAVLGASNNPAKMGSMQLMNLTYSGFTGEVFPVHPRETTICGKKVYRRVEDLPMAPDLAVLVIPPAGVPEMIEAFGRLGTRHAVIFSAGFKEVGKDGADMEADLLAVAAEYGLRFLGPNCMGIINPSLPLNLSVMPTQGLPGGLGIVSQSGTYVAQVQAWMNQRGIRIAKSISVGNEASIDMVDCLEYLGQDPETRAIGLYIECIRRPGEFLRAARRISRHKPIVAQYVGGTEAGARSGASHTGAMAGPDHIYNGLFEQAGVIRVDTIEEVFRIGHALAVQPCPAGKRFAVLTNSGGPGTAMATTLEARGMTVPEFSVGLREKLDALLPKQGSSRNPVDLTFHTDMAQFTQNLPRILLESDEIDGLLIHGIMDTGPAEVLHPMFESQLNISMEDFRKMLNVDIGPLIDIIRQNGKPFLVSSFFNREDDALCRFQDAGIPTFDSPEKAAVAMSCLHRNRLIQSRIEDEPIELPSVSEDARRLVDRAGTVGVDEFAAKAVLRAYGIDTCRERLAHTPREALDAARDLGFPVAVKGCTPVVAHKSEQGLVFLDRTGPEQVEDACRRIQKQAPGAALLVCEMLSGDREVMAGMTRSPGFPPCILFGLGGIYAEAMADAAVRLAPFGRSEALAMVRSLKSNAILGPIRGREPVDTDALADLLVRLGHLALDFPRIQEIDLNPIIICNGRSRVADALFVL
jgi:acetate---CoA ligase (ADP-forming)